MHDNQILWVEELVPDCLCFCIYWSDSWEQKGVNPPFIRECGAHLKRKMINRLVGQIRVWKFAQMRTFLWRGGGIQSYQWGLSLLYFMDGSGAACLFLLLPHFGSQISMHFTKFLWWLIQPWVTGYPKKKKKPWFPVIPIMYAWV